MAPPSSSCRDLPAMALTESLAEISAPVERVHDISQDDAVRYDWDLFPGRIEPLSPGGAAPTVDAQVRVRSRLGMGRVVAFVQEDAPQRAAVSMVAGPWFLARPLRGHVGLPAAGGRSHAGALSLHRGGAASVAALHHRAGGGLLLARGGAAPGRAQGVLRTAGRHRLCRVRASPFTGEADHAQHQHPCRRTARPAHRHPS